MDRKYVISGLIYAILGMSLGIYMAASNNHGQMVTHAHIMLAAFVVSFIYGLCHRLWLTNGSGRLAKIQFLIHQVGVLVLVVGLFLLYGNFIAIEVIDPVLALASVAVLIGMILMTVLFLTSGK
ncbi:TonB-dependent receptor [Photobacterium sp. CCB-ST2H9]|uniref:TonB-dependent receptor n=1 Tax=unclassified Photobacterium TaxID=2628852 RepID=UPI002003E695|nr:TonB-dependent receptor [Photobacterium sp. CCB-ST2H9]UTM55920.1 TonB-dependent receptor [Photobacterium sp. CCB-ST2H9]